jgi:hypothetical protein
MLGSACMSLGAAVVEDLDLVVGEHLLASRCSSACSHSACRLGHRFLVAPADGDQLGMAGGGYII